jgi:hypothetical protein
MIIANCFNCGFASVYNEGTLTKKFKKLLLALGIAEEEIRSAVVEPLLLKEREPKTITLANLQKISTATSTIQPPPKSLPLGHGEFAEYQEKLISYLLSRKVDLKYPFFFSLDSRFIDHVIIPFYRQGNLIYWQARSVVDSKKRYDNAPVSKEAVIFNFDQLYSYSKAPLFVTEGVFDAMMVDGIAILGSKLSAAKKELLSRSKRRLVFVIDKDDNGRQLAEESLRNGWEISFVPEGATDLNESVTRFGLSYTIYNFTKSITRDFDRARFLISQHCRRW